MKPHFSRYTLRAFVLFLLIAGMTACQIDEPAPENEITNDGELAPDFSLTSLDGNTVTLKDYEDKVVVLFFFGYSCPNCIRSAPGIESNITEVFASNPNFAIIGLDQWNGNQAGVASFKEKTSVTFPLLMQASGTAADYSTTYDRLLVVDRDGYIAFRANASAGSSVSTVVDTVNDLLK